MLVKIMKVERDEAGAITGLVDGQGVYTADAPYHGRGEEDTKHFSHLAVMPHCMHLEVPDGYEADEVSPALERWEKEGESPVYVDPVDETWTHVDGYWLIPDQAKMDAKTQVVRNAKLQQMRDIRASVKWPAFDVEINNLAVGNRADAAAMATWKSQLQGVTDAYKDGEGNATSAIDAVDLDTFVWPADPAV